MKNISLKLDDSVFGETEKILTKIKKPEIGISMRLLHITIDFKKE